MSFLWSIRFSLRTWLLVGAALAAFNSWAELESDCGASLVELEPKIVDPVDLELDQNHFEGVRAYVSDARMTIQRLNIARLTWSLGREENGQFVHPTSIQSLIHVDTSKVATEDRISIQIPGVSPVDEVAIGIGSRLPFQRSPDYLGIRLQKPLMSEFTHGFSVRLASEKGLQVKMVASSPRTRDGDSNIVNFEVSRLYSTEFVDVPVLREGAEIKETLFYWSDFRQRNGDDSEVTENLMFDGIWFVFKSTDETISQPKLVFDGPIYMDQRPEHLPEDNQHAIDVEKFWKGLGTGFINSVKFLSSPVPKGFREKIYMNLHNSEYQRRCVELSRMQQLEGHLAKQGFSYEVLDGKMGQIDFFKFFNLISDLKVPIETGKFGKYHGPDSHALQLCVMTMNLNEAELDLFKKMYREIGHNSTYGWKIWTVLFDGSNPHQPTSPRFWARLLRAEN